MTFLYWCIFAIGYSIFFKALFSKNAPYSYYKEFQEIQLENNKIIKVLWRKSTIDDFLMCNILLKFYERKNGLLMVLKATVQLIASFDTTCNTITITKLLDDSIDEYVIFRKPVKAGKTFSEALNYELKDIIANYANMFYDYKRKL